MSIKKPLEEEVEDIQRFEQILKILFEEGFGFLIERIGLLHHLKRLKNEVRSENKNPTPKRVRKTFERLGPTFIKFGQILSERPDIIPEEYCEELEKLEGSVPPFKSEKAKEIVDDEIGLENFKEFEDEPLASASISQVHKARLKNGEEVAVKVRRPGIEEKMGKDLDILIYLGKKIDRHLNLGNQMILNEIKEFSRWTKNELDLRKEGKNAKRFRENLSDEENVKIPEIYLDHTSRKVLTMEFIDAVKYDEKEELKHIDVDPKEVADTGIRSFLKQLIRDGFIHVDPHPSNFKISQKGELVYLDFGMMADLTPKMERNIGLLILNTYEEDVKGVMDVIKEISYIEDDADIEGLKEEMNKTVLELRNSTIRESSISKVLLRVSIKAAEHGVYLPTKVVLIGKGLVTMEGIGLKIYPEFRFSDEYQKLVKDLIIENNANPKQIAESFFIDLVQNQDLVSKLPSKVNEVLESDQKTKIIERSRSHNILPAALLLGSAYLLANSLTAFYQAALGSIGLFLAIYLIFREAQ